MRRQLLVRRTTYIVIFCVSLLLGLFLAKYTSPLSGSWLIFAAILSSFLFIRKTALIIAALITIGFLFGWWRGGLLQAQNQIYEQNFNKTVSITARSTEDGFYANNSQLEFTVQNAVTLSGEELPGKIRVRGFGEAQVYRHDIVQVRGKLYPMKGGRQASISFAEIDVLARSESRVEDFRRNFIAGMQTALPEPAASLGVGILIGQRSLLPDDIALAFMIVGLTHIVAVSGYNLTIIARAVQGGLRRLSRFQILFATSTLIYLFLLVTGFSPSIVRAAIVSGLGLLAWYFGRQFRPMLLILLTAAITALWNPYYVWADIGWYLSFAAFFGVLILAPLLQARIFAAKEVPFIGGVALESFSAQIMTLPILMFIFAKLSLVGLIANIIVVPLIPFAMLFSLFAGLAGMLVPVISGWFALPARILLDVIIWVSESLAKIPNANIPASLSFGGLVILYLIIGVVLVGLKRRAQSVTIEKRVNELSKV